MESFERESNTLGLPLVQEGIQGCVSDDNKIHTKLMEMVRGRCSFGLVLLCGDFYGKVKFAADSLQLVTQCIKWKNVMKPPSSYFGNVLLKLNAKLGGVNHTLASRLPQSNWPSKPVFQQPPASLSWLFDKPCMLIGIDVSHPETFSSSASVAAVVRDQYCNCAIS